MADATTDRALIRAAQGGDGEAFAALVRAHAQRLHRYLVATGVAHHDAEDLVQDAFVRVHAHLDDYDPRYAFTTWLFTIAHRLRLNAVARRRDHLPIGSIPEPASQPVPPGGGGDAWAIARRVLPEALVDLLWLRYGEDLDTAAIARITGCTEIAVRVRLHRARARLEPHLRGDLVQATEGGAP
jgi:RNA polymerase sigma-70 factor (ECF subfamily)